jgi:HEAT repeat protein
MGMRMRVHTRVFLLLLAIVGICAWRIWRSDEPDWGGHRLSYWQKRIDSADSDEAAQALAAVEKLGPVSTSTIRRLLSCRDNKLKRLARVVLAQCPWKPIVRGPEYWRHRARLALILAGRETAIGLLPEVRAMLHDPDPRVREDGAEALGGMLEGASPALADLEAALKDSDAGVRTSAEIAVVNVKGNIQAARIREANEAATP